MPDSAKTIGNTFKSANVNDIVLVGHPFAPIGMGEHVRSSFRAFRAAAKSVSIKDVYGLSSRDDASYEAEFAADLRPSLSRGVNIFHMNGDEIEQALAHMNDPAFEEAYNIVYPAWELSKYPDAWARQLERFDEVWAPSEFIGDAIRASVDRPVIHMPLAVEVNIDSFQGRRHFQIPDHVFCFLFFFDFSSYMERKNPFAMIDAFLELVKRHPNAPLHCVLKFKGGSSDHPDQARLQKLLREYNDRIQTITHHLSDNEIKNLIRCSDCFVSLHRSEGFGRGMAEAMSLGRPVVATGYSGNMDFMTEDTSWIVEHKLIKVAPDTYPHWKDQVWADPSLEHAVDLMEDVFVNRRNAKAKAEAARKHMRVNFCARAVGLRYLQRLAEIAERGRVDA